MTASDITLYQTLGYSFRQPALLREALTHRSATGMHNERLEFLGDALLNLVIAEVLFQTHPKASEGDLSRLRALLVRGEQLAELARQLRLGDYLQLGSGELKSGGFRRASILADALEALVAAVYLDSDFETCKAFVLRLYEMPLANLPRGDSLKDPKTRLQEYVQGQQRSLPSYQVVDITGEPHNQTFTIQCEIVSDSEVIRTHAQGQSRRQAEQEAARLMLTQLCNRESHHHDECE